MTPPRLSRRGLLRASSALALSPLAGWSQWACRGGEPDGRPNILFVMADDLGSESLGCYGGTSYETPHLDRLAAEGLRFTQCFATPQCTPSRVQLLTGQYPFRTGFTGQIRFMPRERQVLDPRLPNFVSALRAAGYATAVAGKWQLARFDAYPRHAERMGFDEHFLWTWRYRDEVPSRYWAPGIWHDGALREDLRRDDVFGPDEYAAFLIDFIERHRARPFFAFFPMTLPHLPYVPVPGWDPASERGGFKQRRWQRFAQMVRYMDALVGRVVNAVDALGLRERTLVLFGSDNGNATIIASNLGDAVVWGAKGDTRDRGTRVPLIARWPGTTPVGTTCADLVDLSDFYPTLADLSGASLPAEGPLDGRSFARQLRGEPGEPRSWVHVQLDDVRALRARRWKLYRDARLFDLESDPDERSPLSPGEGGPEAIAARRELEAAFASLDAPG